MKTIQAKTTRAAILKAIKGAKPVKVRKIAEARAGAYDFVMAAEYEIDWDNGATTRHWDEYCGENQLRGGMYRGFVEAVGVEAETYDSAKYGEAVPAACEHNDFAPNHQKRWDRAIEQFESESE